MNSALLALAPAIIAAGTTDDIMRPQTSTPPTQRSLADTIELSLTAVLVLVVLVALLDIFGVRVLAH